MVPDILRARRVNLTTQSPRPIYHLPEGTPHKGERLSGDNLTPSDGYSTLFTSGLMHCQNGQVKVKQFPSTIPPSTLTNPNRRNAPSAFNKPNPTTTSPRRRRSSILNSAPSSPQKYKSPSADIALENGMRLLRVSYTTTPSPSKQQSRWSLSSEETIETVPRRSGESVRSKLSGVVSLRSRKSEDKARPGMEELMDLDPVPPVPRMPEYRAPVTPGRLAKLRNLLTPKKRQAAVFRTPATSQIPPPIPAEQVFARPPTTPSSKGRFGLPRQTSDRVVPGKGSLSSLTRPPVPTKVFIRTSIPTTPSSKDRVNLPRQAGNRDGEDPLASLTPPPVPAQARTSIPTPSSKGRFGLPQPPPGERVIPKKGSFASLKSLAKKGSSTTLRGLFREDQAPALPPATPSRQYLRPAKSSIGPPTAHQATSPSVFLNEMPRPAPVTPRKDSDSVLADYMDFDFKDLDLPEMSFSNTPGSAQTPVFTPHFSFSDIPMGCTSETTTPLVAKAQRDRTRNRILPCTDKINSSLKHLDPSPHTPSTPRTPSSNSSRSHPWQSRGQGTIHAKLQAQLALGNPAPLPPIGQVHQKRTSRDRDTDSSTFGRRSQVDFTASPGKRMKRMSDASMTSSISLEGTEDWELERFLREVESKEKLARQSGRI